MLLLLLSQQALLPHFVSHWVPAVVASEAASHQSSTGGESEPDGHACQLCSAAAQLAAALPTSSFHLAPIDPHRVSHPPRSAHYFEATPALAFRSRAPPVS